MTFRKTEALQVAYDKAARLSMRLSGVYDGPLVIAGGWVRDHALGFTPKDCDVFVDGGLVTNLEKAVQVANEIVGPPPYRAEGVGRQYQSYGTWAQDVDHITQLFPDDTTPMDLVVLRREAMVENGYQPDLDYPGQCVTFLGAVLKRLDLRINAIGASAYGSMAMPDWDQDAAAKMLVLQASRKDTSMEREDKRLYRLLGGKFQGWSVWQQHEDGSLTPYKPGTVDVG